MRDFAERLTQEFYLSADYDPKAARHADTVQAAIAFAMKNYSTFLAEYKEALKNEIVRDRLADGSLTKPLDITDWEEVTDAVASRLRREGLSS